MLHQKTRPRLGARLVQSGFFEAALAGLLGLFAATIHLASGPAWQALVLDLAACVAAAITGIRPRLGGALLGVALAVYLLVPSEWATLGEYAAFIPILGTGLRGSRRARLVLTTSYFPILCAITWFDAPSPTRATLAWVFWAVSLAVLWVIGNVFAATVAAQEQARAAELARQRQALARGLHDTVARSLTRVTMAAERARLHGSASDEDLATISEAAANAAEELRWVMVLLREPGATTSSELLRTTSIQRALAQAEATLIKHGFQVTLTTEGATDRLTGKQSDALASAIGEAAGNVVKHAEPDSACGIFLGVGQTEAELVLVNRPRPTASTSDDRRSMGLDNIRHSIATLGGHLVIDNPPGQWITRVRIPLAGASRMVPSAASHA